MLLRTHAAAAVPRCAFCGCGRTSEKMAERRCATFLTPYYHCLLPHYCRDHLPQLPLLPSYLSLPPRTTLPTTLPLPPCLAPTCRLVQTTGQWIFSYTPHLAHAATAPRATRISPSHCLFLPSFACTHPLRSHTLHTAHTRATPHVFTHGAVATHLRYVPLAHYT